MKMTFNIDIAWKFLRKSVVCRVMDSSFGLIVQVLFVLVVGGILVCAAQTPFNRPAIRGKVLDPNKAVITGAKITVRRSGATFSAVSDGDGDFSLVLAPGEYTVRVSAPGFVDAVRTARSSPGAD